MSAKVNRCMRCGRRQRTLLGWNIVFDKGTPTGHLCPNCQTPEENAEAEIREATTDYTTTWVDPAGKWWAKPKGWSA